VCLHTCGYSGVWVCACTYVHVFLLIQHAMHMHHVVMSFVAPWSVPHFSTYLINGVILGKKVIEHKICVIVFSTTFI
jgi:hypothetical protein